jgi:Domain of unknown function (DUF397)
MNEAQYTGWRKSSYSNDSGNCVEVATGWRKSSYSDANGGCVEVAGAGRMIAVRDTKQHGRGPILECSTATWRGFIADVKSGKLDLRAG